MVNNKKSKLDKAYTKIIKDALKGKNTDSLKKEFFDVISLELNYELDELTNSNKKKVIKNVEKLDTKLSKQLQEGIEKDLSDDGKQDSTEFRNQKNTIKKDVSKEIFDLQKEIQDFKQHGQKTIERSNGITLQKLQNNTQKLNENRLINKKVGSIRIKSMEYDRSKESLKYYLQIESISKSGKFYDVVYYFYERSDLLNTKKSKVKIKNNIYKDYDYVDTPSIKKTGVSVSCTCEDYMFTFSNINFNEKCYYGKSLPNNFNAKPEQRNPDGYFGICRHLLSGVDYLKQKKFLY